MTMRTFGAAALLALTACGAPMLPPGGSRRAEAEEAAAQVTPLEEFPAACRPKVGELLPDLSFKFTMAPMPTTGKPVLVETLLGEPGFVDASLKALKRGAWTYRAEADGVFVKHPDGRTLTLALLHAESGRRIYGTKGTFAEGLLASLVARAVLDVKVLEGKVDAVVSVSIESPAWAKTSRESRSRLEKRIGEFAAQYIRAAAGVADDITRRGEWFYGWLDGAPGVDPALLASLRKRFPGGGEGR